MAVVRHGCPGANSAVDFCQRYFRALTVGESGAVNAGGDDTILAEDARPAFVSNAGRIRSLEDALDIRGGGPITIVNTGTLFGGSDGIVTTEGSLTRIVNRGTIDGDEAGGIDHLGGDTSSSTAGRSRARTTASMPPTGPTVTPGEDEVRNFGSIEGGVFLYGHDDFVENRGEIDFVDLGGGDDIYFGRGTGSAGRVDGGDGEDLLVSSRADDTFIGGGAGDLFIFLPRGGDDRILDFGGTDRIDLSDFELASFAESATGSRTGRTAP